MYNRNKLQKVQLIVQRTRAVAQPSPMFLKSKRPRQKKSTAPSAPALAEGPGSLTRENRHEVMRL